MNRLFICLILLSNSAFAQVDLTLGLKAYYPFTGNANDASGNNNNPAFNNATPTTDRFGNSNSAYHFNGVSSYMRIPNNPSLNMTNQMSLAVWVKPLGFYTGTCHNNMIIAKGDADYLTGNYSLRYTPDPLAGCVSNPPYSQSVFYGVNGIATSPFVQLNRWYSVVWTSDGVTAKIYVDCELKGSVPAGSFSFTNSFDLYFGKMNNSTFPYWLNGDIDEIRIYDRALSFDEVKVYGDCSLLSNAPSIGGIINNYTPVLNFLQCENKIVLEDATAFNMNDTVMLIQMKGAVIDSSNTASFGTITDYKNSGNYEINYVKSKSGNEIELKNIITRQYDIPTGKVQLIRVPYYQNVNITSSLTCLPWDGNKGGVVVLNAQDTINLNADIDVSGKGFKGGIGYNPQDVTLDCFQNNYNYPGVFNNNAGQKGESITSISQNIMCGKGSPAGGGGGGLGHNSGGGGGGNGGVGGFGGYQLNNCGSFPYDNRGIGGHPLNLDPIINRIYLGSGGGAGEADNPNSLAPSGGNGGGIIIILSDKIKSNSFLIKANGNPGLVCVNSNCHDGMGGGGAGGTVLLGINQYIDNTKTEAKGGNGANMTGTTIPAAGKIGPGGGGGGGGIFLSNAIFPVNLITNVTGGPGGVLTQDANNPYGTTPGSNGVSFNNLIIPVDITPFTKNIDSVRIRDSAIGCSTFDFKGLAYTNTNPIISWQWSFGDGNTASTQNTLHSYSSSGTYLVKLVVTDINGCKDSISRNIISGTPPDFDFNYQTDVCNPLSIQFTGIGSDIQNPYWAFGDGATATGIINPVHLYATTGNYIVRYSVSNGSCTDTISKTINISLINDNIILTQDTTICAGSTKQLLTTSSLGFCWSPVTYLNNPNSANPITSTPQNITYYYTAQVQGANIIVNGDFSAGNTGFSSAYNYATPNVTEGQYYVGSSPQAWNPSLSNCGDHTTGTGNMMLVNGSPVPDVNVWRQTVAIIPNTNYAFSTWIQALWPPNPAQLKFSINGNDVGTLITASLPTCTWTQFYTTWNSGNSTSATISIVNKNTAVQGNDFALDDIVFAPVLIKRDSVKITVDTPRVMTNDDISGCEGIQVQLATTGASAYSWSPATGLSNPAIGNPVASPTTSTQYIVTGTTVNGCIAKDTVNITINPKPIITKSGDTTICQTGSAQLTVSGGVSYSWQPPGSLNNNSISNPVASPSATTTYYVTVTDINNCTNNDSIKVTVNSAANFSIDAVAPVCSNRSVQLNAYGGDTYIWQPSATLNNPSVANPCSTFLVLWD